MNFFYLFAGIVLYFFIAYDIIKTTFSSSGGGKITDAVSKGVWNLLFFAAGKNGRSSLLNYAGPVLVVSILLTWITGLWLSTFLVFLSDTDSIVNSQTLIRATTPQKLYYTGYTLSTLGIGDYKASTNSWRIVSNLVAFSGLAFITASLTYFIPVLSAVGLQSKLSLYISGMGKIPQQTISNSWNGKDFSGFFQNTSDLCQMLMQHTVNHKSYPIIHYFHNNKPELAISVALAQLDETYHLLKYGVPQVCDNNKVQMNMLGTALHKYLEIMSEGYLKNKSPKENAPVPDFNTLNQSDLPFAEQAEVQKAFTHQLYTRRQQLTALLEMDGWSWNEVYKLQML